MPDAVRCGETYSSRHSWRSTETRHSRVDDGRRRSKRTSTTLARWDHHLQLRKYQPRSRSSGRGTNCLAFLEITGTTLIVDILRLEFGPPQPKKNSSVTLLPEFVSFRENVLCFFPALTLKLPCPFPEFLPRLCLFKVRLIKPNYRSTIRSLCN